MANGHGGYRAPAQPAPVSGPGALSRRTDGKQPVMDLPNAGYGEGAQFRADQQSAPMPQASPPATGPTPPSLGAQIGQQVPQGMPTPVPLSAGSMRPGEPVTAGADSGPGPGSSSLKLPDQTAGQHASALALVQSLARQPLASPAVRFLATSLSGGF